MLGIFQQSQLRIEVEAKAQTISESLLNTNNLKKWLWTQQFSNELPEKLTAGMTFTTWTGIIPVTHYVEIAENNCLRLILSQGIDGYHEWYWGDGWVQSKLEGITLLPLKLGHSFSLLNLKEFLKNQ
jgi:hypothetical protein